MGQVSSKARERNAKEPRATEARDQDKEDHVGCCKRCDCESNEIGDLDWKMGMGVVGLRKRRRAKPSRQTKSSITHQQRQHRHRQIIKGSTPLSLRPRSVFIPGLVQLAISPSVGSRRLYRFWESIASFQLNAVQLYHMRTVLSHHPLHYVSTSEPLRLSSCRCPGEGHRHQNVTGL